MKKLLTFFLTALLAFSVGWAANVFDYLTVTQLGVTSSSYTEFSNINITTSAVYAGQCANNNGNIQLRATSPSGIVSTTSGGTLKRVEVFYASNTPNDRTVDVYGSNTPYNSAADLYNESTRGTYLGTITINSQEYLEISGNYTYVGLKSYRNALYLTGIRIHWDTGGSTACATPTINPGTGTYNGPQTVTISSATSGATIYYTTDGNDPTTSSSSIVNGGTVPINESCTLKAMAVATGYDNSIVASANYTITSGSNIYRKVTSTSDLVVGKKYILVYEGGNIFMGAINTSGTNYGTPQSGPTISNSIVDIAGYDAISELTLYGDESGWSFHNGTGYISWSSGNSLTQATSITDNSKWTLEGSASAGYSLKNFATPGRVIKYNTSTPRFACYTSGQQTVVLYVKDSAQPAEPSLSVNPNTLTLNDIPYDGSSTSGTFHLTGANLTGDVTVTVNGADFSVNPTSISPVSGTVNQDITVTYSGSSTTEVTATITITSGTATETVTVTAKKATPPAASITITPTTQTFNDNAAASLTVEGTFVNGSINASLATNTDWYMNPNTFSNAGGTTSVTYNGRALSASNTVTAYAANNNSLSAQATVNYVADLYIVGDYGSGWNFNEGVHMTNNNGVYTAAITTEGAAYILFARKTGEGVNWNTRYLFGPSSDGNWWLPAGGNGSGSIDLYDDDPIYIQNAGTYIVTINANAGTFTIERETVNTGDFVLVTDVNDLVTGYEVIIVNSGTASDNEARAMSTTQNSNNRGSTPVAVSATYKVSADDNVQILALQGSSEGWYFKTVNGEQQGYLYAASNSSNYLRTEAVIDGNGNARAFISFSNSHAATITFQGNNSHNLLQYNTSNGGIFSCYSNTQRDVFIYQREANHITVANPVISPESGRYSSDQEVTITCETTGATIYYTINGGAIETYSEPFNVELNDNNTEATIVAWAELDGNDSKLVTVTYTFKKETVNSIAEFNELEIDDEVTFGSPVTVLFDYSQESYNNDNEPDGQEYIWVKDNTGYTQFYIKPAFDNTTDGFVPKYENGDVIPAGFKVKRGYFQTGGYFQGQCYLWQDTFDDATTKALADPEQVTLSELLANPADYNDRYLYINKLQVSDVNDLNFRIATDENDDNVADVQGGTAIVGYNKYNSPAWKNKQGQVVGVELPTDNNFYNVKFIFQKWQNGYEIMPIEFTPWEETSLRLEDLVQVGVKDNQYTISNPLIATKVTWDDNHGKFAIFAKDDEMYANKRYPNGLNEYSINYQNGALINTVAQKDYDQSNWIEILIPSNVTSKTDDPSYQTTLVDLQGLYENKILDGGTIKGYYRDTLNPTIEMSTAPTTPTTTADYTPNFYCTANFLMENIDADGATSYRDNNQYFMMDGKPQEFGMVIWAYYPGNGDYFYAPMQVGDEVNGHNFRGSFKANMALCEDPGITKESTIMDCFDASNENGNSIDDVKMYGFKAIVRKNPAYWTPNANGAPRRTDIAPNTAGVEGTPAYIVYPLNAGENASGTVTDVTEVNAEKSVVSVRYFNVMGMESEQPFDGINIIVTSYSDGSRSAIKVLK